MLWPGTLIMMEERIPGVGVTAFALMASGGDLGAAIAPQLTGVIADAVLGSEFGNAFAKFLNITPEQASLKAGILFCAVFPIMGIVIVCGIKRYFKR